MAAAESGLLQQALQYGEHGTRRPPADRSVFICFLVCTSYATKHLDGTTSYRLECWSLHWVVVVAGFRIKLGVLGQVSVDEREPQQAAQVVPIWGPVIPKHPPFPIAHSSTQRSPLGIQMACMGRLFVQR
jgi:hypothetical protein